MGYSSFEHYLEFNYFIQTQSVDLDQLVGDLEEGFKQSNSIKGNIRLLTEKYYDESIAEELEPIINRVKQLPLEIQNCLASFEAKLRSLFFMLLIEKNLHNEEGIKYLQATIRDSSKQYALINPEIAIEQQKILDFIDGVTNKSANQEIYIQTSSSPSYFPDKASVLISIQDELVKLDYMEPNNDFIKTFLINEKRFTNMTTIWKGTPASLFYLLYRLNNNGEFVKGERIDGIANKLFRFNPEKTADNLRTSYNRVKTKVVDEDYLMKKMEDLKNLLDSHLG